MFCLPKRSSSFSASEGFINPNSDNAFAVKLKAEYTYFSLKNGAAIGSDSDGTYFGFDGIDDYIDLETLPVSINFGNGFIFEFKAKWESLNSWSRILDLGNGQDADNIVVANYADTARLDLSYIHDIQRLHGTDYPSDENMIFVNQANSYKIEVLKNDNSTYDIKYYLNGKVEYELSGVDIGISSVVRTKNFIGKSNWDHDGYFKGKIYYMRFRLLDGTVVLNADPKNI